MKVKYKGPNMGATGPQDGGVYEVKKVDCYRGQWGLILVDENADGEAYYYNAISPILHGGPGVVYSGGHFFIVEDEDGQLAEAGLLPLTD